MSTSARSWPPVPHLPPRAAFRREATWRVGVDHTTDLAVPTIHLGEGMPMPMTGDGNGWVGCALGHRHWGRFGAAGILITDGARVVLQHRARWTHEGGTWAVPGGARDSHEDPLAAALREAAEETTLDPADVTPYAEWVDEHGGWSYTTVLATTELRVDLAPVGAESDAIAWWPIAAVADLPLHHGFAAAWPHLRERLPSR